MKKKKEPKLLLGAHMSIAGGIDQAITRAEQIGCTVVQFFSKSNRQWRTKELTSQEIARFKQTYAASSIQSTTIHASYLINIGSSDKVLSNKSRDALQEEFKRANQLGVDHLIFHPGAHKKENKQACLDRIAEQINSILTTQTKPTTKLLLETMAGQGSNVCYTFEQLAYIYDRIEKKQLIGICFDTCHVYAAGYDIKDEYEQVIQSFDTICGLDLIQVIHINDSKKPLGSRVDRHEHIGKGLLGLEPFKKLFNDERFFHVPKILETPKESLNDDIKNMQTIKKLISANNRKKLNGE